MKSVKHKLASACSILLGVSQSAVSASEPWIIDLGVMNYIEQDRNTGLEFIGKGTRELQDGGSLSLAAELDVITGATPNGATSSNVPQTFTMSSGVGSYSVNANELPADDTHMDTRLALKAGIVDPVSERLTADYNALISMEFDYLAFAAGGNLAFDFNQKNTTMTAGINLEYNRVHPVGNTPIPFAAMQPAGQFQPRGVSSKRKTGEEFSLGLTQVIDQTSLAQIRLTTSHFSGYLTDPYKMLSLVDDQNLTTLGATQAYLFENRPDSRRMNSLYLAYKKSFSAGVLDLSVRLYDDDWDVQSQTFDIAYKYRRSDHYFVRPAIRLYKQDAASFYRHSLRSSEALPLYASADDRLAEFNATTLGIEFGKDLAFDRKQSFTIEYYTQQGDSSPQDAIGLQQQQDLYPGLKTLIFKYVYSLKW
jgi:hypothetical protein